MAKGSGGTRTQARRISLSSSLSRIDSQIKGEFTPKSVFGRQLTVGDIDGVRRVKAMLSGTNDIYDINIPRLNDTLRERGKDVEVMLSDIYPSQTYLNKERVAMYMSNPSQNISDRRLDITGYRLPNGKVVLDDGHHRVAALLLNGGQSVNMKVVDISEYNASRWFKSLSKKK